MATGTANTEQLAAALRYAGLGWRVFPCAWVVRGQCSCGRYPCPDKPGKHPLYDRKMGLTRGCKDATTDANTIRRWWKQWPQANPAIATGTDSGVWVLGPDGDAGVFQLGELAGQHPDESIPATPWVRTGSRGQHLYFRWPADGKGLTNRVNHRGLMVDVRGTGGYVIAPPGVNANGEYEWLEEPWEIEPAEAPAWLLDWVRQKNETTQKSISQPTLTDQISPYARKALESESERVSSAGEGTRHNVLNAAAFSLGQLVGGGEIPRSDVESALAAAAGSAGLPEGEVVRTIRDGIDAGLRSPRNVPVSNGWVKPSRPSPAKTATIPAAPPANESEDNDELDVTAEPWPDPMPAEAMYGLVGDVVRAIDPHTEADPVAILFQFLVGFGNMVGRHAYYRVEDTRHYPNLFCVLVGQSSRARKGTSWQRALRVLERGGDEDWAHTRIASGLSSGEGLIWEVRDPPIRRQNTRGGPPDAEADPGAADKRLLVIEEEFASVLQVGKREGNILGGVLRSAWDTGVLRSLVKNNPARATGAHISIIGHITRTELVSTITNTQAHNGFLNRFLWVAVRRSKLLPYGGQRVDPTPLAARLEEAFRFATHAERIIEMTAAARGLWGVEYARLTADRPGLFGLVTSRSEAQTLRLALVYALLDESLEIDLPHLKAALAIERYVEQSAKNIFGNATGDPLADEIEKIVRSSADGVSQSELVDYFGRNKNKQELQQSLTVLVEAGRIYSEKRQTAGRPQVIWKRYEKNELNEKSPPK